MRRTIVIPLLLWAAPSWALSTNFDILSENANKESIKRQEKAVAMGRILTSAKDYLARNSSEEDRERMTKTFDKEVGESDAEPFLYDRLKKQFDILDDDKKDQAAKKLALMKASFYLFLADERGYVPPKRMTDAVNLEMAKKLEGMFGEEPKKEEKGK